jgi:hypothetical protein
MPEQDIVEVNAADEKWSRAVELATAISRGALNDDSKDYVSACDALAELVVELNENPYFFHF